MKTCEAPCAVPAETLERWRQLWSSAERPTPNAQPERFLAVCRATGASPAILEVEDDSGRRGMIIARRERMRITRRVGYLPVRTPALDSLVVVYGGVLGDAAPEAVVRRLGEAMQGRGGVEHVMLNKLHENDGLLSAITLLPRCVMLAPEPHWVIDMRAGYDSFISKHSGKHRSNLRRLERRLFKAYPRMYLKEYRDEGCVEEFAGASEKVSAMSYQSAIGAGPPPPGTWRALLGHEASQGQLLCYALIDDDDMIAYQAGALYGSIYYCEGTSYRSDCAAMSPGTVLLHQVLKKLGDSGPHIIDFGFGDAIYKRTYGTKYWEESSVHVYGHSVRAKWSGLVDQCTIKFDMLCKRVLGSSSVQAVKRWRRGWMKSHGGS